VAELEHRLIALREEIAWPETPKVTPTLDEEQQHTRGSRARLLAVVAALLLVALAGVLAFAPGARSAFLELFHIRGATMARVDRLPEVDARPLDLGRPVGRDEAERRAGFTLVDLGDPDRIYVRGHTVSLVYGPAATPRLVLTELRGGLWKGFVQKVGASGTRVETVTVDGAPGLFVSGDQHFVMFLDATGAVADDQTYLAGTVLLWNRGELLLRLEGDLSRAQAITLAESIG
jgi:hypothetical protein